MKWIKLSDKFSIGRDNYCWHLKQGKRTTYHPTLDRVTQELIDRKCGECETLQEIIDLLKGAIDSYNKFLSEKARESK